MFHAMFDSHKLASHALTTVYPNFFAEILQFKINKISHLGNKFQY